MRTKMKQRKSYFRWHRKALSIFLLFQLSMLGYAALAPQDTLKVTIKNKTPNSCCYPFVALPSACPRSGLQKTFPGTVVPLISKPGAGEFDKSPKYYTCSENWLEAFTALTIWYMSSQAGLEFWGACRRLPRACSSVNSMRWLAVKIKWNQTRWAKNLLGENTRK